ncbi:hypothetical protein KF707_19530 [Candidatus Obscuribacterales bacterium]|nr:hypothetical protein [Candidatus Obscuribacterales bacterium]
MTTFNKNKNSFKTSFARTQLDFHAYSDLEVTKDTKNPIQEKRTLLNQVKYLVESIDTEDFGIRVIVMKSRK